MGHAATPPGKPCFSKPIEAGHSGSTNTAFSTPTMHDVRNSPNSNTVVSTRRSSPNDNLATSSTFLPVRSSTPQHLQRTPTLSLLLSVDQRSSFARDSNSTLMVQTSPDITIMGKRRASDPISSYPNELLDMGNNRALANSSVSQYQNAPVFLLKKARHSHSHYTGASEQCSEDNQVFCMGKRARNGDQHSIPGGYTGAVRHRQVAHELLPEPKRRKSCHQPISDGTKTNIQSAPSQNSTSKHIWFSQKSGHFGSGEPSPTSSSALSRSSLEGQVIGQKYLVMHQIGRGTNSTIHKGRRLDNSSSSDEKLALKIVSSAPLSITEGHKNPSANLGVMPTTGFFAESSNLWKQMNGSGQFAGTVKGKGNALENVRMGALDGKLRTPEQCIKAEASALKSLQGLPTVVDMLDCFTTCDGKHHVLVLEHLPGGSLLEVLKRRASSQNSLQWSHANFSEDDSAHVTARVVHALCHCHRNGFAHLDIKPENIIFASNPARPNSAKLADFGLACKVSQDEKFTATGQFCGSAKYMAPELIINNRSSSRCQYFTLKSDMWSLGVVTHLMLTGRLPFLHKNYLKSDGSIFQNSAWKEHSQFISLSPNAKDFVLRLLCIDEARRMSSVEAWRHPFLSSQVQILRSNGIDLSTAHPWSNHSKLCTQGDSHMDIDEI